MRVASLPGLLVDEASPPSLQMLASPLYGLQVTLMSPPASRGPPMTLVASFPGPQTLVASLPSLLMDAASLLSLLVLAIRLPAARCC